MDKLTENKAITIEGNIEITIQNLSDINKLLDEMFIKIGGISSNGLGEDEAKECGISAMSKNAGIMSKDIRDRLLILQMLIYTDPSC